MSSKKYLSLHSGFTLAEVLITLGIIGVVAAITIPTLMNNVADAQYKTAYKKAYSVASQAWLTAYNNGDLTLCTSWADSVGAQCNNNNFLAFQKYVKVSKNCGTSTADCWDMSGEKVWSDNFPKSDSLAFIDASGMAWVKISDTDTAPEVLVDTNGSKKPNQFGKDRVVFTLLYLNDPVNAPYDISTPKIGLIMDCTGVAQTDNHGNTWPVVQQLYRCPSYATHPCYYTSWITGAK